MNWPLNYKLFDYADEDGESVEHKNATAMFNIPVETEKLRHHFGLSGKKS